MTNRSHDRGAWTSHFLPSRGVDRPCVAGMCIASVVVVLGNERSD
ncbi:MAG: hypothetical protein U0169_19790 [Polyangiaceae bacterium]